MGWHKTFSSAIIVPLLVLIVPLPVRRLNKLTTNVPNSILRNPPFCSFSSFLIVSLTPFFNNPNSSRDLTILTSLEIIKVAKPEPKHFYQ